MGQKLHIFHAPTLQAAYRQMRDQLGDEALVVRTTQVREGGFFGLLGRKTVELIAAGPETIPPPASRKRTPVELKYAVGLSGKPHEASPERLAYFEDLIRSAQLRMSNPPPQPAEKPAGSSVVPFKKPTAAPRSGPRSAVPDGLPAPNDDVRRQLREVREMLEVLYAENPGAGLPFELAPHYRRLTAHGCSRKAAASLIGAAVKDADPRLLGDHRLFVERLRLEIQRRITVTGGIGLTAGASRVVAVVGATGVGKTTTLAKLAAHFAVRRRARVALISADTYRVAAPEQLRVYANIIGIPMRVADDAKDMVAALRAFRDCDLVFVDTAGGSQFNAAQIQELKELLAGNRADEVLLLLGANTQLDDLRQVVASFGCLKPTSLVFTKLDETRRYGGLFSLLLETGLPLSYFSAGQNVPDDLVVAQPRMVAQLLLGASNNRERPSPKSS